MKNNFMFIGNFVQFEILEEVDRCRITVALYDKGGN